MSSLAFIHDLRFADLPAEVVHQARRCLLDLIGVAAAGRRTELSRIVHGFAVRQMGASEGGARLLFDGRRASAAGAAFAGASTIDSFDAHDGHALTKGHAGVAILPALLAVADAEQLVATGLVDGREILTALVIGYEIAIRAGIALHGSVADYHTSGAWNALACAAITARLLRLTPEETRHALGIAEYHGPRSQMMRCIDHPTMLKDGSGWGAFAGVSAAYLAQDGFSGAPAITMEAPEQAGLWSDLGTRWRIGEQYFKPWPVCRWAQPAVEAAATMLASGPIAPAGIVSIEVETFAEAVRLGAAVPATTEAAQYALGFPLAAFLVRGRLGAAEIGPEGLADPAIAAMTRLIVLRERAEFSRQFPAKRQAVLRIVMADGEVRTSPVTTARGDPDAPLGDADLKQKFSELTDYLSEDRSRRICETSLGLGAPDVSLAALMDQVLAAEPTETGRRRGRPAIAATG
ncbi:MmgE/PrpD family protein [Bosea lathyri]|uniref:2-methylcitrate dehydratase PrpD n=1 Tax=Bosea lathyri TaxID=1036778 RepID=A0A1H5Z193_9HYPH|nr:MmgE/PrpD family protein [Bosea lathyri]SEG30369.1 2-methylcitrate dehydratase PrpD [Bosea lathyri]